MLQEARRLVATAMRSEEVAGLRAAFKALDLDGDGKLSAEELRVSEALGRCRRAGAPLQDAVRFACIQMTYR